MAADPEAESTPDVAPADMPERRAEAARILSCRDVRRAAKFLRRAVVQGLEAWAPDHGRIVDSAVQVKAWPSDRAPEQQVPDSVRDVRTHIERATEAVHPSTTAGRALHPDAAAAVRHAAAFSDTAEAWRDRRHRVGMLRSAHRMLAGVRARLDANAPEHIRAMPTRIDAALLAAAGIAAGVPDLALATDCAVGFEAIGDISPSGWWPARDDAHGEARLSIDELDHEAWHDALEGRMLARSTQPEEAGRMAAVLEKTLEERASGLAHGPFTREQLRSAYGAAHRAMERFGVLQHDKLRPCDNAKTALHNRCTRVAERMVMETADFPARVAVAFHEACGCAVPMRGGTDDIGAFYRIVPCATPQWTIVAVMSPDGVRYFTIPSFNFGLASAPNQCCRVSEAALRIARALGLVCGKFVDDFASIEWARSQESGQWALRECMAILGMPFAEKKHVGGDHIVVFLGVRTDFGEGPCVAAVISVDADRRRRICTAMGDALRDGRLPAARAANFAGKLGFTLTWMAGKVGRAAMQPLFAAAEGAGDDEGMLPSARMALEFFCEILPWLPPRRLEMRPSDERPVLVWSDGASEVGAAREHTVGFVVAVPRADAPPAGVRVAAEDFASVYDCRHGSAELDRGYMTRFMLPRKQQIGQVELVGAFTPYTSLGSAVWHGRRVLHWVDNSSAVAALAKGYSSAIDSAHIVHAVQATLAGFEADVWFEYVRTDANVADDPSREDMSYERYAIGADITAGVRAFVESVPVARVPLPALDGWEVDAAAWLLGAQRR